MEFLTEAATITMHPNRSDFKFYFYTVLSYEKENYVKLYGMMEKLGDSYYLPVRITDNSGIQLYPRRRYAKLIPSRLGITVLSRTLPVIKFSPFVPRRIVAEIRLNNLTYILSKGGEKGRLLDAIDICRYVLETDSPSYDNWLYRVWD